MTDFATNNAAERIALDAQEFVSPADVDCADGLRRAVAAAKERGFKGLRLSAGRYRLASSAAFSTEGIVHDAGSRGAIGTKECHLVLQGLENFVFEGAVGPDGEPATVLVGDNDQEIHGMLPAILWAEDCPGLEVRNIALTREPEYASAGELIAVKDDSVTVRVFEGNPCWDRMGAYCMNRFDAGRRILVGESVTYGNGAAEFWRAGKGRDLTLRDPKVASKVAPGELLSWHQGAQTDFQVYFGRCDGLVLENIRTLNSNGFCMLAENCRDITAHRIVFKPEGARLFTGPRDAWKLFKCSGKIEVSEMSVHGVRMDGQNMHSNWMRLHERLSPDSGRFFCPYTSAALPAGSSFEFYDGVRIETRIVEEALIESAHEDGHLYRLRFEGDMPDFVDASTLCAAACWEVDRYLCRDSEFVNIAGAGHLVRYDNLVLLNNSYRHCMNPGVLLGAELPTHREGGHATNVMVKWCEFDDCGFFPRGEAGGCLAVDSQGFEAPHNRDIWIIENEFRNAGVGIELRCADSVFIHRNQFSDIGERVRVHAASCGQIHGLE